MRLPDVEIENDGKLYADCVQSLAVQWADFRLEHFLGDGCDLVGHYPTGFGQTIIWVRLLIASVSVQATASAILMDLSIASMLNQVIPFFNPHLIRARVAVRNMHSKLLSSSKMITATTLGSLFTLFFCTDCPSYREAQVSGRTCITRRNNMVGA